MKNPVKVSIIVPVYNVEKYLPMCMESCINQTLYDIEIICVNDGSTDSSPEILKQFAEIDNRIRIIDKPNGGLSSARNAGMEQACGQWIMFLDSDDYLSPNACERVWVEGMQEPTDIITFGSNIFPSNPRPTNWHKVVLHIGSRRFHEFTPNVLFDMPGSKPFVWRQAFSYDLLEKTQLRFDENVKYGEDIIFQFEIFPFANKFSYIVDRLYNYRWYRKGSLMESINQVPSEKLKQHLYIVENIFSYWKENGLTDKYGVYLLAWGLDFVVPDLRRNNYDEKAEFAAELRKLISDYGLEQYKPELPKDKIELYNSLNKM